MDQAKYYNEASLLNGVLAPLSRRRLSLQPRPQVAGRQSLPSFSPKCLYALSLHLQFTTPRCRPPSSHILSCPISFPWLGSPILSSHSSSSSSGFNLLLILLKVPSRAPRRTCLPVARPQKELLPPLPASPGTWLSQPISSSQTPSMEPSMVRGLLSSSP